MSRRSSSAPGMVSSHRSPRCSPTSGSPAAPTDNNLVTITRYRVSYRRTDGRNTPGVDVPYGFEGAATVTVDGTGPAVLALEVVRVQAKQEPPLRNLRGSGG